jgi:hypothetical protein
LVSVAEVIAALVLFGLGCLAITVLATLIGFLPAIAAAVIAYILTGSLLYTAAAFLIVAFLWMLVKHK